MRSMKIRTLVIFFAVMGLFLANSMASFAGGMCGMGNMDMGEDKSGSNVSTHQAHNPSAQSSGYSRYPQNGFRQLQVIKDAADTLRTSNPSLASELDSIASAMMQDQGPTGAKTQNLVINQGEGIPQTQSQGHSH